jgi:hypothetical protein
MTNYLSAQEKGDASISSRVRSASGGGLEASGGGLEASEAYD